MNQVLVCLSLMLSLRINSYAQFSAGVITGVGHLSQRQKASTSTFIGIDPAQPLLMVGVYGQFNQKSLRGFVGGVQLRYQSQRQAFRYSAMNSNDPFALTQPYYNRYSYLVATPYIGIRPFRQLEIAVGPEISLLLQSRITSSPRNLTTSLLGFNVKATYWLGPFGLEGGYSFQTTAYDRAGSSEFYNRYTYGVVKYSFVR